MTVFGKYSTLIIFTLYTFMLTVRSIIMVFLSYLFPFNIDSICDPKLKEDAEMWYSDFKDLMEYRRNPTYGNTKCFNCLLSRRGRNLSWD